jgi:hypothetical protein
MTAGLVAVRAALFGWHARAPTQPFRRQPSRPLSPDGKTLVFCSDKDATERYEFNI